MKLAPKNRGYKFIELVFTTLLIATVGLIVYSLLNIGTVLGAKSTAVNTAHQQARMAMLQMVQDLHSSVSLPQLCDDTGQIITGAGPGAGIAFQLWSAGPYAVIQDQTTSDNEVTISPQGNKKFTVTPLVGQRLIIPGHQIEDDITDVNMAGNKKTCTLELANNLRVPIDYTASNTIPCYITDRCSYIIKNGQLEWKGPTTKKAFAVMGRNIISPTPFTTPTTPAGALYYRFVAAIDLSTADTTYSNRGFKSANILLNGQVPLRARLTTYQ